VCAAKPHTLKNRVFPLFSDSFSGFFDVQISDKYLVKQEPCTGVQPVQGVASGGGDF
jgi:hypothetical protein